MRCKSEHSRTHAKEWSLKAIAVKVDVREERLLRLALLDSNEIEFMLELCPVMSYAIVPSPFFAKESNTWIHLSF